MPNSETGFAGSSIMIPFYLGFRIISDDFMAIFSTSKIKNKTSSNNYQANEWSFLLIKGNNGRTKLN